MNSQFLTATIRNAHDGLVRTVQAVPDDKMNWKPLDSRRVMKIMKHSLMSLSPRRRPSAKGFTLIEILVVIAIATILAAMLFAGFSRAKEKGRSAVCQNNLKQIALGMQQYVQDNDGRYPHRLGGDGSWETRILPYIKNVEVFRCLPPASRFNLQRIR